MSKSVAIQKAESAQVFDPAQIIERVITKGDLSELTPAERVGYYNHVCSSLGLNPLTRPFEYLQLQNKLVLYARKDCTEQLRKIRNVSVDRIEQNLDGDYLTVTAYGSLPEGRKDSDVGVICLKGVIGDARANAIMKAVTKAKRRLTLSICGLGFIDESEIETIPGARPLIEEDLTVSARNSGLDQWKCSRTRAMQIIDLCTKIKAADKSIDDDALRAKLPKGIQSRKDLSDIQAGDFIQTLQKMLDGLTNTVQWEVVNG